MNLFINLLFGHLVGDFLVQPKAMAVKKSASTVTALIHVTLYTLSIAIFTTFNWKWLLFVFISHFIVDRWSLADKWLQLIKGRDLPNFFYFGHEDIPQSCPKFIGSPAYRQTSENEKLNYLILRGSFSSIVYTVVDNTFHLMSMYYLYSYIVK